MLSVSLEEGNWNMVSYLWDTRLKEKIVCMCEWRCLDGWHEYGWITCSICFQTYRDSDLFISVHLLCCLETSLPFFFYLPCEWIVLLLASTELLLRKCLWKHKIWCMHLFCIYWPHSLQYFVIAWNSSGLEGRIDDQQKCNHCFLSYGWMWKAPK